MYVSCEYIYIYAFICKCICIYGHVPFSPCSGNVTRLSGFAIGAGPLWGSWALVGRALVAALGTCGPGPCGPPCGPPWALVGRALVGPLGPCGPGPCGPPAWAPWALMGPGPNGP